MEINFSRPFIGSMQHFEAWYPIISYHLPNIAIHIHCIHCHLAALSRGQQRSVGRVVSKDWQGNLRPFIYDDSQMVLAIPIWHRIAAGLMDVMGGFRKKNATKHGPSKAPGNRKHRGFDVFFKRPPDKFLQCMMMCFVGVCLMFSDVFL